jgi:DNA modification methylase
MENITHNWDCMQFLPTLQDWSIDLILTDPPYWIANEIKIHRSGNWKFKQGKDITHSFGEWDKFQDNEDFLNFTYSWVDAVVSKLRAWGMFVCFFDRDRINFLSHYLQKKYGFKIKWYFYYVKNNPVPMVRKGAWTFMSWVECALIAQKPWWKQTFNHELWQQANYIILPICSGNERTKHPTQKPLKLMCPFLNYFTNPWDLVLDPFAWSWTTAVACIQLNRKYIAIEQDKDYFRIMEKRIKNTTLPLF